MSTTTRHVTVPLEYGCRVEMHAPGPSWAESPLWGEGFSFYVGHMSRSFEPADSDTQSLIWSQIRDRDENGARYGCAYPPGGLPLDKKKPMNIYRVTRKRIRVYDDFTSIVVRASDPEAARRAVVEFIEQEARNYPGEHFDRIWSDPDKTEIERIELEGGAQVISAEFRHG